MRWLLSLALVACRATPTPAPAPAPAPVTPSQPVAQVAAPPPSPAEPAPDAPRDRPVDSNAARGGTGNDADLALDPRIGTARGPGAPGPALPNESSRGPSGRISLGEKQSFDETTLTADAVVAKLQSAYFAGLKRCYRNYLTKDPTARGKLALTLTVNETGRAIQTTAKGFSNDVDACANGLMTGWRFPIPKDRDGEPTTASFAIVLMLVPE